MTMRFIPAALLLLSSACAPTLSVSDRVPDPGIAKALAGKIAGKPRSCISLNDARQSTTYRDAILYRVSSRLIYLNDLGECPYLRNDNILVTNPTGSQLCRGDIVTMISRGSNFTTGTCAFGHFVPYVTPGK